MTTVEKIQSEIKSLTKEEYADLRQWFLERDWEQWDRQIERDSELGKLECLIENKNEAVPALSLTTFLNKWRGFLEGYDPDQLRTQYLQEKYA